MTTYIALTSIICLGLAYRIDWTSLPGVSKPSFDLSIRGIFDWLSSSTASVWTPLIGLDLLFERLQYVLAKEISFLLLLYLVAFVGLTANPRIRELRSGPVKGPHDNKP